MSFQSAYESETKDLCEQWEGEIYELSRKEIDLVHKKSLYNMNAELIIQETDFKDLYGRNNDKVRKMHVEKTLKDQLEAINDLEVSIDYLKRHISLLKALIYLRIEDKWV